MKNIASWTSTAPGGPFVSINTEGDKVAISVRGVARPGVAIPQVDIVKVLMTPGEFVALIRQATLTAA